MKSIYVRPLSFLLLIVVACIGDRDPARREVVRALTAYLGDIADPRVGYLRDSTHLKVDVATVAFPTWSEERVTEHARGIALVAYRSYQKAGQLDSVTVAYLEEVRPGMSWIRHARTFPAATLRATAKK